MDLRDMDEGDSGLHEQRPLPETSHVRRLMNRWHETGDTGALGKMIADCLPLVDRSARRLARDRKQYEELVSVGYLAMIRAIHRYREVPESDPVMHIHGHIGSAMEVVLPDQPTRSVPRRSRVKRSERARDSIAPSL